MTQKEAKELTLELWRYLAEHPECWTKAQTPQDLYKKIKGLFAECPLCEIIQGGPCDPCPLAAAGEGCGKEGSAFDKWSYTDPEDKDARKESAELIVKIVSAWEPEEE
jgi:hypothetical protein